MPREVSKSLFALLFIILLGADWYVYRAILLPRALRIHVLPAGKTHAVLLTGSRGETVLIDTGADASILRALGEVLPPWQRRVDAIILTGTSAGGLQEVAARYETPNTIRIGEAASPYGAHISLGDATITVIAPGTLTVTKGGGAFAASSSTPPGEYSLK